MTEETRGGRLERVRSRHQVSPSFRAERPGASAQREAGAEGNPPRRRGPLASVHAFLGRVAPEDEKAQGFQEQSAGSALCGALTMSFFSHDRSVGTSVDAALPSDSVSCRCLTWKVDGRLDRAFPDYITAVLLPMSLDLKREILAVIHQETSCHALELMLLVTCNLELLRKSCQKMP